MSGSGLKYWLTLLVLFGVFCGSFVGWRHFKSAEAGAQHPQFAAANKPASDHTAKDFALTDQHNEKFESASLDGQVWVASFFFTNCPGTCLRLNQALAELQKEPYTQDMKFVSITCDPENDTPEALDRYAKHFGADPQRWIFLTGKMSEITRIGNDSFQVAVERGTHSDRAFIVDASGKVRGRFRLTEADQFERLKKLLESLAEEPAAGAKAAS